MMLVIHLTSLSGEDDAAFDRDLCLLEPANYVEGGGEQAQMSLKLINVNFRFTVTGLLKLLLIVEIRIKFSSII